MSLEKVVYTTHASAHGGRDGEAKTDDGALAVKLAVPKEMGGPGGGNNPEQLFAAGYAACFLGAMKFVASQDKSGAQVPHGAVVHSSVGIGPRTDKGGFGLTVELKISLPGVEKAAAEKLMHAADIVCPYSNAIKGNVEKTLTLA